MPALYQGTVLRPQEPRILNLDPPQRARGAVQRQNLTLLDRLNRRHLELHPGEADLTQWADYPLVLEAAVRSGADVTGCIGQGAFLKALGIEARAQRLMQARPDAAPVIQRQLDRLTAPEQMGELFKAAAIFSPRSLALPGF